MGTRLDVLDWVNPTRTGKLRSRLKKRIMERKALLMMVKS
jgi:hypothetical protein